MVRTILIASVAVVASSWLCPSDGAEIAAPQAVLGRKIDNFRLNDAYGKSYELKDYRDKKAIVIAFIGTECPLAKLYGPRLAELADNLANKGVQFLAIDSNRQDSITRILAYARIHKVKFPILKDLGNKVADQFTATRTPEVFLLDNSGVVRYHGRIDDQYGVGYARKAPSRPLLAAAIDELLAGKPLSQVETAAVGCFIGRVHNSERTPTVTYCRQVSRILNKHCVNCHRQGEIAPFALTTYEEVSGWADTIAEVVRDRRMPPWHADPKFGHFSNDRSVSEADKNVLYQWALEGAPEGDSSELPPPPQFVDGWQLPKGPDKVYHMSEKSYSVPAEGAVAYKYFVVDPGFQEDKWIKAIEARPGNRSVVHHIIVFAGPKGAGGDESGRQFLVGYAPGAVPLVLPPGSAKFVPKGYQLVFQMHYTPNGSPQEDRSKVGFVFADPKEVTHMVRTLEATNHSLAIPPNADDYEVEAGSIPFGFDMDLINLFPHMHLRGKSFRYDARYPDGKTETLLNVPGYDFGWQTTYQLTQAKHLPKGTVLHCTAHYCNSEENLNNPDPSATVRWGDQTWEEMMIGFFDVSVRVDQADIQKGKVPNFNPNTDDIAKHLIDEFDKDHDGKISEKELPDKPLRIKFFFLQLDTNKDGFVTADEIASQIKERRKNAAKSGGRGGRWFAPLGGGSSKEKSPSKDQRKGPSAAKTPAEPVTQ